MLLHLGKDKVIPLKDIIAIIDAESAFKSEYTKEFFKIAEEDGFINSTNEEIKSYILTERSNKHKKGDLKSRQSIIYTSNISTVTLQKRAGFIENI
ncbi:hypothetical protein Curi_c00050 [Gottschalkia acidurici 9a]|uniref:DUF370 domain-containing protein n=1 Tax=Gottschalkia acidurici (strain ATCC 7906 / DSM 604 / BCRC 14475 / CIP 104303 / KCTC 5404 / NCIMB 10678 / 9a) TaxID=1128398 RepID=K0AWI1_GOTA9|nr:extracellular matrix/biofilm biosynthesis regulator RemA family protein [Gottschalkia acidurici]AFS77090.1 hypothetical protein Curi_c00050 [Gottschalkia acidurici 9a]